VAFYSTTLSASDIYTHYLAALAVPSPVVNVSHSGTSAVISWPAAAGDWVLDSTPSLSPVSWTPVQTNGSPATVPLNGSYNFFRLRSQ